MSLTSDSPPRALVPIAIAMSCAVADPSAQEPAFADVMRRAHAFVVGYEDDLSTVVAKEQYEQQVLGEDGDLEQQRVLVSDYRVTQLLPYEFWFGVREVFEVDGAAVRERTGLAPPALRLLPGEDPSNRLTQIAEENARFNIGDIVRTVNEPTFALTFLRPQNRDRMRFVSLGEETIGELLTQIVGYREVPLDGTTFIGTQDGDDILTRGRFWIDPTSGRVIRSELVTGDARVERTGSITVDYQFFPNVNLSLPVQMREIYKSTKTSDHSPTITGTATYSNYRVLTPAIASLTVAWDRSPHSDAVGYIVAWGETPGRYRNEKDVGNVTKVTLDRLVEGHRYYVVVRSYTAEGTRSLVSEEASGVAVTSSGIERR